MEPLQFFFDDPQCRPYKKHHTDAGWDLRAAKEMHIPPGQTAMVPTGVSCIIPEGYVGIIKIRSSTGKMGLSNTSGVIDADYRGQIQVLAQNHGQNTVKLEIGQRFAQILVMPCLLDAELLPGKAPNDTDRGEGGFGSTGIK
ncbi:MAG TPA: dUTP diphosphatase [Thermotogota bacterium]|nr:dUTP diphosphatase [Thermotogota bacterium]HRW93974.1 dUTP diphosphatase [Thermotogota bacterium]